MADPRAARRGRRGARARLGRALARATPPRGLLRGGLGAGRGAPTRCERTGARVVHAHNVQPTLGWRALAAARAAGARVVLHLHNYRLVCAVGTCFTHGADCTRCHGRNTLPGVRLNCRGGSRAESAAYAAALALWQQRIAARGRRASSSRAPSRCGRLRALGAPLGDRAPRDPVASSATFAARSRAGGRAARALRRAAAPREGRRGRDRRLPRGGRAARRRRRRARRGRAARRAAGRRTSASRAASAPATLAELRARRRASRVVPSRYAEILPARRARGDGGRPAGRRLARGRPRRARPRGRPVPAGRRRRAGRAHPPRCGATRRRATRALAIVRERTRARPWWRAALRRGVRLRLGSARCARS